jgi:large subunit ribosomal protein L4e
MKVEVFDLQGKYVEQIELPKIFEEPVREDLIRRAVLAAQSSRRQPYGTNIMAGLRTSAHYHGRRRIRPTIVMMGREMARLPRLHGKTVPFLNFAARLVPQAVKGREAHPPKVEKIWKQKINEKERKKAVRSAIAATAVKTLVAARGHRISSLKNVPVVVEDDLQKISKTKELIEFLKKIGLEEELKRISKRKIRAGKGKMRGRKYRTKVGPLFVVAEDKGISKAVKNILGADVCLVKNLSAELLAPGTVPGRLTIFTKSALQKLGE